ncbi:GTP 3',8-cyclase MoaA [Dendrosporobacter sp. 1207_IL3150]|uniref:GTP 3',8-cyclase MoaA n=1 Tax=Dendrosporobacter sp. 1207_IL3150 TaxID=3084054 RepID=UPI002FD97DFD
MMRDGYGRIIDYLRISVTDRCNFRCVYCMPPEGVSLLAHDEILSYEEILRVVRLLGQHGVSKIRITGGEPLVRKGIVEFIRNVRKIESVKDLAMTTNGSLLSGMADQLKAAGLDRVNVSVDTVNHERFADITGRKHLTEVLAGIRRAVEAQLTPVKLNVVLTEALWEDDLLYLVEQTYNSPIAVRFIEYMPIGRLGIKPGLDVAAIKNIINKAGYGCLQEDDAVKGNGPAKYFRLPKAQGVIGFITPISEHFCPSCNRLRLTADGKIKSCLLLNNEIDIKACMRGGGSDIELYELFLKALQEKPGRHRLSEGREEDDLTRRMFQVGG